MQSPDYRLTKEPAMTRQKNLAALDQIVELVANHGTDAMASSEKGAGAQP